MGGAVGVTIPKGFLTEWCETLSRDGEMPAISYLPTGLVLIAAIVGVKIKIRWTPVRDERCNLWILNVGRSAMHKKTTGLTALRWGIKVASERLGDEIRYHSVQRLSDAGLADMLDVVGKDTAKAQKEENAAAKLEKREPSELEPVVREMPVSQVLALNEVAPIWGEARDQYRQNARQLLLDVYDGRLSSSTKTTQVFDQEVFTCALGNIPEAELSDRTTDSVLRSGFAGRWVVCQAPDPIRLISFPHVNGTDPLAALADRIRQLTHLHHYCADIQDVRKLWTDEAVASRQAWYERRVGRFIREAGADGDVWNRLQATAVKLAVVAAISRQVGADFSDLGALRVEVGDAEWAQELVEASLKTLMGAVAAGGGGSTSPTGRLEQRILNTLTNHGARSETTAMKVRAIADNARGDDSRKDVVSALLSLHTTGSVEVVMDREGTRPQMAWLSEKTDADD